MESGWRVKRFFTPDDGKQEREAETFYASNRGNNFGDLNHGN